MCQQHSVLILKNCTIIEAGTKHQTEGDYCHCFCKQIVNTFYQSEKSSTGPKRFLNNKTYWICLMGHCLFHLACSSASFLWNNVHLAHFFSIWVSCNLTVCVRFSIWTISSTICIHGSRVGGSAFPSLCGMAFLHSAVAVNIFIVFSSFWSCCWQN